MTLQFKMAAEASEIGEDEDVVEVPIGDRVFLARRPTTAQGAMLAYSLRTTGYDKLSAVFKLIKGLMGEEVRQIIEEAIWDRRIDFGDLLGGGTENNPELGLIDGIFAEFQTEERPTKPSTVSSSSRKPGGRPSTGRSPGAGSTRSPSPSTAS